MKLNVMYFARYREALGLDGETVDGEFEIGRASCRERVF